MELNFKDPTLEFKGLIVKFLPSGKVLVIPEGTGVHYTLHPGNQSGVIDLHKTNEQIPTTDTSRYQTLAAIPQDEIVRNLSAVGAEPVMSLLSLLRPIRIGWIARRRLGVVALPTEAELDRVSGIRVKKAPTPELSEPLSTWMKVPEFIDEIWEMPNATFLLCDCRKDSSPVYGLLFKIVGPQGELSLRWIRLRDLRRWSMKMEVLFAGLFNSLYAS